MAVVDGQRESPPGKRVASLTNLATLRLVPMVSRITMNWIGRELTDLETMFSSPWRISPLVDCNAWRDFRLEAFLQRVDVRGKRLLEPGCNEGVFTCRLCAAGACVTAFDCRPRLAAKTFVRCLAHGHRPTVFVGDAEQIGQYGTYDVVLHSGLLYHLADPVTHLRQLAEVAPTIFLSTQHHVPSPDALDGYSGWRSDRERGWHDDMSAGADNSFWLSLESLHRIFNEVGLSCETIAGDVEFPPDSPRVCFLLTSGTKPRSGGRV
jgi:hypothetical protein